MLKKSLLGVALLAALATATMAHAAPPTGSCHVLSLDQILYFLDHGQVRVIECYY